MPANAEYLTIDEAAEVLRCPTGTLYAWRHRRTGPPARKIGKRLLYNREQLIAWVESQGEPVGR